MKPVVVDAFDREAVVRAVEAVRPQVLIHQLTNLSAGFATELISDPLARNSRLRIKGTRNLVAESAGRLRPVGIVSVPARIQNSCG